MAKIELNEFASRGIVLMIEGKPVQVPFQILRWPDKRASIRIGYNMLHFDANGVFDGAESRFGMKNDETALAAKQYAGMLESTKGNLGLLPRETYYLENSPGFHVERNADPGPRDKGNPVYQIAATDDKQVELHAMTDIEKEMAVMRNLPASGISHLCVKMFGPGEIPSWLFDEIVSLINALKADGTIEQTETGTIKLSSKEPREVCTQCDHLMIRSSVESRLVCLNCGARK